MSSALDSRFFHILFVGGQEVISPVRCAPPSPVLRPRSRISRCFCSFAAPRACLCRPLPLRPRASDIARTGKNVAPDPDLHAAAARAASRPRQRRRGRLERGRLTAALLRRRTFGQLPGRVVCVGGTPTIGCDAPVGGPATLATLAATLATLAVRWAVRRGRGRWRVGHAGAERGSPQRRACGDGVAHGRRRANAQRSAPEPRRRAALAWVDAHALYVCRLYVSSCAPVAMRRSGGSTCCVGRTTTARLLCIRSLYEC